MNFDDLINSSSVSSQAAEQARQRFTGIPGRKSEAWKYSNLGFLKSWSFQERTPLVMPSELYKKVFFEGADHLFFLNGAYDASLSMPPTSAGVDLNEDASFPHFERDAQNPFFNLNVATSKPLSIRIADDVTLKRPLHIVHFSGGASSHVPSRTVVHVGERSQVSIIESFLSEEEVFENPVLEIQLADRAELTYASLQRGHQASAQIGSVSIRQQGQSKSEILCVSMGSAFCRTDVNVQLCDSQGSSQVDGLYLGRETQFVDFHTSIEHSSPETFSRQLFKGVMAGRSKAVFNGRVHMVEKAAGSESDQLNKNLMLSKEAEVNTKPELAIEVDDVKAAHGATIGQIQDEEVFYLQSRGIPSIRARRMLARGFAYEVLHRLTNSEVRSYLFSQIENPLEDLFEGEA